MMDGNQPHMNRVLLEQLPPNAMHLSEQECRWALSIKEAASQDNELNPISDFEYAHHAIVSKDNVEDALGHIRGLQYFREEYNIQDSADEGIQLFEAFLRKHPGFVLSVECDEVVGHFIIVYDYAKRSSAEYVTAEESRAHLGGLYYLAQAVQSHLTGIREGIVHICECEGMGWHNSNLNNHRRDFDHLWSDYPLLHKEISWLRTPLVANLLFAFLKPLMTENMRERFQLGCTFYGYDGRIDSIFKAPTFEVAQANLLIRMHRYLSTRYQNQATFRLPDDLPPIVVIDLEDDDSDDE